MINFGFEKKNIFNLNLNLFTRRVLGKKENLIYWFMRLTVSKLISYVNCDINIRKNIYNNKLLI